MSRSESFELELFRTLKCQRESIRKHIETLRFSAENMSNSKELNKKQNKFLSPNKFIGALMVELIRAEFIRNGIEISPRDVFIENIPFECDLLILNKQITPSHGIIYTPGDVKAVIEIKTRGNFGEQAGRRLLDTFDLISAKYQHIQCIYLTLYERENYKYRLVPEKWKYSVVELFSTQNDPDIAFEHGTLQPTGEWEKFIKKWQVI
jgi:hypothetical protein